jgi:large subunit ribosomal protein L24
MAQRHVRKGDQVVVTSGRYKGQKGELVEVLVRKNRVRVAGVATVKRHLKANPEAPNSPGGITEKLGSIAISNVSLIDPKSGRPTRSRIKVLEDGKKVRIATRSGEPIAAIAGGA